MESFTESQLRESLRHAAGRATVEFPMLDTTALLQPVGARPRPQPKHLALLAAAAVVVVTVPLAVATAGRNDSPAVPRLAPTTTGASSDATPSQTSAPPVGLTRHEIFAIVGYPWRQAEAGDTASIEEAAAIRIGEGSSSLGLVWVGIQESSTENEANSDLSTTWRLTWVVVSPPRTKAADISKPAGTTSAPSSPQTVQDVSLVDARTGELYAQFVL